MLATKENIQDLLLRDDFMQFSYIYSYKSKKFFQLCKDMEVQLSNGEVHKIPKGMYTDLCSAPKFIWGLFQPYGDFLFASIVHDYIYIKKPAGWSQKKADKEMLFWSGIVNGGTVKQRIDNYLRYAAVRLFGRVVWEK
ncbi:MAG: DUF1353 domain-containing protein [Bacteroidia bacterium]